MNDLTAKEKYKLVKDLTKKHKITAYEISKYTNLSQAGILNIISGRSIRPHESTLNEILSFLEERIVGSKIPGTKNYLKDKIIHSLASEPANEFYNSNNPDEENIYLKINNIEVILKENFNILAQGIKETVKNTRDIKKDTGSIYKNVNTLKEFLSKK